jgi:hypothetical protein
MQAALDAGDDAAVEMLLAEEIPEPPEVADRDFWSEARIWARSRRRICHHHRIQHHHRHHHRHAWRQR